MLVNQSIDHDDLLTRGADEKREAPITQEEFDIAHSEREHRVYRVRLWDDI